MKRLLIYGILFVGVVILSGCTKIVNIEIPDTDSKPVVFSLIAYNKPVMLFYNKSYNVLDYVYNDSLYNASAEVKLFINREYKEQLYYQNGYFFSNYTKPLAGDTVEVQVLPDGQQQYIIGKSVIPQKVTINSVVYTDSIYSNQCEGCYSRIDIGFKDIPNQKNYYEIYLRAKCNMSDSVACQNVIGYASNNPVITSEGIINSLGGIENNDFYDTEPLTITFSDSLFQNDSIYLDVEFIRPCEYITGQFEPRKYTLIVYLSNVSEEYYFYRKSMFKHLISKESNLWSGYVEPIQVYSNVTGGYGVIAGYNPDSVVINPF